MSRNGRIAVVVAAAALAVAAFVVAKPSDDEEGADTAASTTPAATAETTTRPTARPRPQPSPERIRITAGRPVGGVRALRVKNGDTVRLQVSSNDTSDEVHVHGYDLTRSFTPRRPASFRFRATLEGVFEIELHGSHEQIASLSVEPR